MDNKVSSLVYPGYQAILLIAQRSYSRQIRISLYRHKSPSCRRYGLIPRTKNGPALGGYGAVTMANALKKTVTTLPAHLKQSLTWDRGKELSDHARFTIESGVKVFFADPAAHGSAARTKTRMAFYGNTSPRVATCPDGAPRRSTPSPMR